SGPTALHLKSVRDVMALTVHDVMAPTRQKAALFVPKVRGTLTRCRYGDLSLGLDITAQCPCQIWPVKLSLPRRSPVKASPGKSELVQPGPALFQKIKDCLFFAGLGSGA
ncbi:MAG TPA: hypothetical protein VNU95_15260, partial [Candidatus Acidoferrales bacterium]|nr:hypothetical protein [Candidatus Acidoferrales bacterium]